MGLVSLALLPVRAAIGGAELLAGAARLAAGDGPLRRPGGYGERLDVLLAEDGPLEQLGRLGDPAGPLARLEQVLAAVDEEALERLLAPDGPLDRLAELSETLAQLAALDESLRTLGTLAGALDELAASTRRLPELGPSVDLLAETATALQRSASTLSEAVVPLSRLAGRLPGGGRRAG